MSLDLWAVARALEQVVAKNLDHMDDYNKMADQFAREYYSLADEPGLD